MTRTIACLALLLITSCEPTSSSPAGCKDCKGCCIKGTCHPGSLPSACGLGGVTCTVCSTGQNCYAGQCTFHGPNPDGGGWPIVDWGGSVVDRGSPGCPGCFQGTLCVSGNIDPACGKGGIQCVACRPDQQCIGQVCVNSANPCANCHSGCCLNGNQCMPGTAPNACGIGGAPCVDCQGRTCDQQSRQCIGCANCQTGCCNGQTCEPGTADNACGQGARSCYDCTSFNLVCNKTTRYCEPPCKDCSTGCCHGRICVAGKADNACGSNNQVCVDCASLGGRCDTNFRACTGGCPNCQSGCCDGNTCKSGSSNLQCGKGGIPCQNCTIMGLSCHQVRKQCE
jgi:hypothetical protein